MRRKVHVELLIGKPVLDPHGEIVGHIEEIRAEWSGNRCLVEEYHLGTGALLERLGDDIKMKIGTEVDDEKARITHEAKHKRFIREYGAFHTGAQRVVIAPNFQQIAMQRQSLAMRLALVVIELALIERGRIVRPS